MTLSVGEKLKQIIIRNTTFTTSENDINDETDLINDLGFDSINVIKLLAEIENEYGIEFEYEFISLEFVGKYKDLKKSIETRIS